MELLHDPHEPSAPRTTDITPVERVELALADAEHYLGAATYNAEAVADGLRERHRELDRATNPAQQQRVLDLIAGHTETIAEAQQSVLHADTAVNQAWASALEVAKTEEMPGHRPGTPASTEVPHQAWAIGVLNDVVEASVAIDQARPKLAGALTALARSGSPEQVSVAATSLEHGAGRLSQALTHVEKAAPPPPPEHGSGTISRARATPEQPPSLTYAPATASPGR